MKITDVTKSITYYTTTDDPEFPDYRTDEYPMDEYERGQEEYREFITRNLK